ncbi:MAG TPA: response regulator [Rhizomicrobium sp.]
MDEKLKFSQITALVVDNDQYATNILGQILRGFGLAKHLVAENGEDGKRHLERSRFDLIICEAVLPDMPAGELVRWIRRHENPLIKYLSIVTLTGYTQPSNVFAVRDSGTNTVVGKPVAPNVLFDHIAWITRADRPFIETDSYVGPCRRFKNMGPPDGIGRRKTDLAAEVGAAKEPNLSQEEIDAFIRPTRVAIE